MISRLLRPLALFLTLAALGAHAQSMPGSWSAIPTFGSSFSQVVETPSRTFALANGFLLSLDDEQTYFYSRENLLSDSNIDKIQYNYDKGYLLIAYTNGNIDLLYDDDHVVNMPEIKDAQLTASHQLGNIDFGADRIAIATQFGMVIYDDDRHEVVESGMYNTPVENVLIMGDKLLLYEKSGAVLRISPLAQRHPRLDSFESVLDYNGNEQKMWGTVQRLNDNTIVRLSGEGNPVDYKLSTYSLGEDGRMQPRNIVFSGMPSNANRFGYGKDCIAFSNYYRVYTIDRQANADSWSLPAAWQGTSAGCAFTNTGRQSVWTAGPAGIAHLDCSSSTSTVLMDWYKPQASPVVRVAQLLWSANNEYLYISHVGNGNNVVSNSNLPMQTAALHRSGTIKDVSVPGTNTVHRMTPDCDDPELFYMGVGWKGMRVYNHDGLVQDLTVDQVPFPENTGNKVPANFTLDPEGNLWMVSYSDPGDRPLIVLPAAKRRGADWSTITKTDWLTHPSFFDQNTHFDSNLLFSTHKPYAIMSLATWAGGYMVIHHNGSYTDFSDDTFIVHTTVTDQTGSSSGASQGITCMTEDHNGVIWLGTCAGVLTMPDIAAAMQPGYNFTRPLVARNDGTNYGDYLLATEKILAIAVDHSNRKWIGTEASGLYLVSSDGSEILEHFTTDNSPLPSNMVCALAVDPESSKIYIGTPNGLYCYDGTSSPAAADYSDVNVYPNPVRPDYTGNVVISGLMDGSLVKIADANGNVVFTTRSEGGSAMWDVCNQAGRRVSSGVYFIMASQSTDGSTGTVAKIMVIN